MGKRIFIGIPASKEIQSQALVWKAQNLSLNPSPSFGEGKMKWIESRNLHVTLVPPWEEDNVSNQISKLKGFLASARNDRLAEPFIISFSRISLGPNEKDPKLIWATGPATPAIVNLKNQIEQSLKSVVNIRDGRHGYRVHVTLARLKSPNLSHPSAALLPSPRLRRAGGAPSPSFGEGKSEWAIDWQMKVDRFVLYESHLLPEGAEYKILQKFAL